MFSLMGNCISSCKKRREPRKELTLAILGLDDVGKTTTTKALLGESLETAPTVGFCNEHLTFEHYDIKLYDLGGGKKIRDIWKNYYADVHGIIYVVDSSMPDRMEESKDTMSYVLEHPQVTGKPLLVLANKQDLATAMDEVDICEQLNLENTVNMNKCPCRIEKCSAKKGTGRKIDKGIKDGLRWLCNVISHNWETIKERVDKDMEEEKRKEKIEADARRERVKKIREERERKEKEEEEEKRRMGIEVDKDDSEEEDFVGDPFKRLDVNELRQKELKLKEEKHRRKEFEKRRQNNNDIGYSEDSDDLGELRAPRSNRALNRYDLFNGHLRSGKNDDSSQKSDEEEEDNFVISSHGRRSTPRLPPLQRPLGTKFSANEEVTSLKMKKKKKKDKLKTLNENESEDENKEGSDQLSQTLRSVSKIDFDTKNGPWTPDDFYPTRNYRSSFDRNHHLDVYKDFENERISPRTLKKQNNLDIHGDENIEGISPRSGKKKGKKKKPQKTQIDERHSFDARDLTSPRTLGRDIDEDSADSYTTKADDIYSISSHRLRTKLPTLDGGEDEDTPTKKFKKKKTYFKKNKTAPSYDEYEMRNNYRDIDIKRDYSWTQSPQKEDSFGRDKWNFAEDLPEVDSDDEFSRRRTRPNIDSDEDLIT